MVNPEADRLWGLYLKAKAEFERVAHSETIMADKYEATRERAKAALKKFRDQARNLSRSGTRPSIRQIPDR